jgi:hypothetical protein
MRGVWRAWEVTSETPGGGNAGGVGMARQLVRVNQRTVANPSGFTLKVDSMPHPE